MTSSPPQPDDRVRTRDSRTELLLLVAILIWAANYPLAKYGLERLDSFVFNSIRFIAATVVLGLPYLRHATWKPIAAKDMPGFLRAGLLASVLYQVLFIIGLTMTSAGNSAVLLSTSPLWTLFLHARMHREPVEPRMWIGMILSFAGIVMIIIGSGQKLALGGTDIAGDLIMLVAAGLWGLNTNLQKPLLVHYSALQLSFVFSLIGAAGLTVIAVPSGISLSWGAVPWPSWIAAILSGTFSIGIGNAIWSRGVQRIGPGRTANFNNLIPVLAIVISYLTLHEELLAIQFVGAAVTILGVWIVRR